MADANVSVSFSASINDFVSGVGQAKDALQSFSAPFGEINAQLSSLATASSQAFNPSRLQPYRDALDATKAPPAILRRRRRPRRGGLASRRRRHIRRRGSGGATRRPRRRLKLLADGLKQKLALYAEEARFYEITQQQKLELSQQAISQEYAAELGALQRQDALGEQSLASKQRVDDMLIEATRRRDDQMAALTRSALQDQERDYQAFGSSIGQAFNSQLRGLLTGTTTWHTAFKNALEDLLIKFIEWCETSVAHYVLAEAMKTAATTAGRRRTHRRGTGRRCGVPGRAGRDDGPIYSLFGGGNICRGVWFSRAAHGPARDRPCRGGPGDGRRHGGRRRIRRHRYVASPERPAGAYSPERTHHARWACRRACATC